METKRFLVYYFILLVIHYDPIFGFPSQSEITACNKTRKRHNSPKNGLADRFILSENAVISIFGFASDNPHVRSKNNLAVAFDYAKDLARFFLKNHRRLSRQGFFDNMAATLKNRNYKIILEDVSRDWEQSTDRDRFDDLLLAFRNMQRTRANINAIRRDLDTEERPILIEDLSSQLESFGLHVLRNEDHKGVNFSNVEQHYSLVIRKFRSLKPVEPELQTFLKLFLLSLRPEDDISGPQLRNDIVAYSRAFIRYVKTEVKSIAVEAESQSTSETAPSFSAPQITVRT